MLAYVLALAVGLGSLGIYLAAFFFPEVHRKNDFIWSGVGLFYALVLWVCAGRITGGLLLGQAAGVALLGWSVTQMLWLRRSVIPRQEQTKLPSTEEVKTTVEEKVSQLSPPGKLSQLGDRFTGVFTSAKNQIQQRFSAVTQRKSKPDPALSKPSVEVIDKRTPVPEQPQGANATEQPTQLKQSPLGAEFTPVTNDPAGPDMPGASGKEAIPVEAIAPEVELAPPAELPGLGDPQYRQNPPPPEAMDAVPIEMRQSQQSPSSEDATIPEPIPPHPPDPELVEAAIRDAEEKHQPASPPETESENP